MGKQKGEQEKIPGASNRTAAVRDDRLRRGFFWGTPRGPATQAISQGFFLSGGEKTGGSSGGNLDSPWLPNCIPPRDGLGEQRTGEIGVTT